MQKAFEAYLKEAYPSWLVKLQVDEEGHYIKKGTASLYTAWVAGYMDSNLDVLKELLKDLKLDWETADNRSTGFKHNKTQRLYYCYQCGKEAANQDRVVMDEAAI